MFTSSPDPLFAAGMVQHALPDGSFLGSQRVIPSLGMFPVLPFVSHPAETVMRTAAPLGEGKKAQAALTEMGI